MQQAFAGMLGMTSFPLINTVNVLYFDGAWNNCSNLTTFPLIDTSSGQTFGGCWAYCDALTVFPELVMSSATIISTAWEHCIGLTAFPPLLLGNVQSCAYAWQYCLFFTCPVIGLGFCTNFEGAFSSCVNLDTMPQIDTSNGTNFNYMFSDCPSLTGWDGNPPLDMHNMTSGEGLFSAIDSDSYNLLLSELAFGGFNTPNLNTGVLLANYNALPTGAGFASKAYLVSTLGWTVQDADTP
jgi:hypothetical protein